ncbi:MAG: TetR/AcrR family transcriptional regulator [Deltaproteobacteria bacterium]|nr:TetR/AcrR family transcriptional regulator [Deltaproteobacteria bacterium]
MPRPREFDTEHALDAAVALVWKQGYAGTSVRQLCEAMEINPGSFYAAFDSKDAFFRRVLARYVEVQLPKLRPQPAAIRRWFRMITASSRRGQGCLLVNAAVESPGLDPDSQAEVSARLGGLEAFFVRCLGEHPHAKAHAELLVATVVSIHVMSRGGSSMAKLRRIADHALELTGVGTTDAAPATVR